MSPTASRRCFVLIAVLVITGSALFITTGLLFLVQSSVAALNGAAESAQSRALGWSGVQAVMSRLNDQRSEILEGRLPRLERQYTIYEAAARRGVVRLLPLTADGQWLSPEAGRLDLNHVEAEALAATGLMDQELAEAIVDHREQVLRRPYQSVGELLAVPGMTAELLYGALEELSVMDEAQGKEQDLAERVLEGMSSTAPRGLADLVTVYAFEPALQRNGRQQINLNTPWSDELGRRIDDRFGEGSGELIKGIIDSGVTFDSESVIYQQMLAFGLDADEWPDIVDGLTAEPGPFHYGRLDVNEAPYEALLALPGVTPEAASGILETRSQLTADERSTAVWPVIRGLLEPQVYEQLGERVTVRSFTYRVQLAAGEVAEDDPDERLISPVIYELVIDLSDPAPRIAFLRDITYLQTTARIASSVEPGVLAPEDLDEERMASSEQAAEEAAQPLAGGELADEGDLGEPLTDETDEAEAPAPEAFEDESAGNEAPLPTSDVEVVDRRLGRWRAGG